MPKYRKLFAQTDGANIIHASNSGTCFIQNAGYKFVPIIKIYSNCLVHLCVDKCLKLFYIVDAIHVSANTLENVIFFYIFKCLGMRYILSGLMCGAYKYQLIWLWPTLKRCSLSM